MAKVLLVEDDNNLREIFEMRLQAEGYDTMTAGDGEEALVVAMKQKPDLIIADVMMPKLSGFEMLETLRATPEMNNTKVIMMTALGQAEDRARGEKLGVVKYLVKSQVTLEDFVRVVRDVLQPGGRTAISSEGSGSEQEQASNQESEKSMQDDTSVPSNSSAPAGDSQPATNPMGDSSAMPSDQASTADEQATVQGQVNDVMGAAPAADAGVGSDSAAPASDDASDEPAAGPSAPTSGPTVPPAAPGV